MPIHRLTASAPYVPVTLRAGRSQVVCLALIDTGASISAVHPDMIREINAQVIGLVDVSRIGTSDSEMFTYYCSVSLADERAVGVEVVAAPPSSPCQMLIGRDLMSRWLMAWDGPGDRLIISY